MSKRGNADTDSHQNGDSPPTKDTLAAEFLLEQHDDYTIDEALCVSVGRRPGKPWFVYKNGTEINCLRDTEREIVPHRSVLTAIAAASEYIRRIKDEIAKRPVQCVACPRPADSMYWLWDDNEVWQPLCRKCFDWINDSDRRNGSTLSESLRSLLANKVQSPVPGEKR